MNTSVLFSVTNLILAGVNVMNALNPDFSDVLRTACWFVAGLCAIGAVACAYFGGRQAEVESRR